MNNKTYCDLKTHHQISSKLLEICRCQIVNSLLTNLIVHRLWTIYHPLNTSMLPVIAEFNGGFTARNLWNFRQFSLSFSLLKEIWHTRVPNRLQHLKKNLHTRVQNRAWSHFFYNSGHGK